MKAKQSLSLRQTQRLALSPGLMTGLAILRLSAADLIEAIEAEAIDNPYLIHDDLRPSGAALAGAAYDVALDTVVEVQSLVADLHRQIGAMTLPPRVRAIAEYLAGDVTEEGFLDSSPDELARALDIDLDLLMSGLRALQSCDPAGVGARTLAECLQLQLVDRGVEPGLAAGVVRNLALFAAEDWRKLRLELALDRPELLRLAAMIRELRSRPVEPTARADSYLVPDLVLEQDSAGRFRVHPGPGRFGRVRLNTALVVAGAANGGFAADRRMRAEAIITALTFRTDALLRIGAAIAERQSRFFAQGPDHLAPMSRRDLAQQLGLHGSTIGRAVSSKSLDFNGRLYPLSVFFSTAVPTDGDQAVAAFVVQRQIARLVAQESPDAPLSDDAICAALRASGVDIARRTVAKYRGCMRIPSSFARRSRKAPQRLRPATSGRPNRPID